MSTLEIASIAVPALMLEQTRMIRASRARVYEAWTNPEVLKQWFGPAGMYCPCAMLDVHEGGGYRIDVHPLPDDASPATTSASASRQAVATGTYTRVVPNELLQFTWIPSWMPGEESLVTVVLRDAVGGTEITIRHERFATEASRSGHNKGWADSLNKLAAAIERS